MRTGQLRAGGSRFKSKRSLRIKSVRRRRQARLRCQFAFSPRVGPYSRIRPFWVQREYKKKYLRRLTLKKRSRLARLRPAAQFSAMIQSIWGHLDVGGILAQLPKSGWYGELTSFARCIGGLNQTIGAGHFSSLWSVSGRIAAVSAHTLPGGTRNAPRARRTAAGGVQSKGRRQAGTTKGPRRFRKSKKQVSRTRYTDLVLQVPSQFIRHKLRAVLYSRTRSYTRHIGRTLYRNSINGMYIPRIHARLPFNPKWLKRQTKPTSKKKTILMSKRMCAVEEKSQRAALRRSAVTLGGQPTLTLRRWYLHVLVSSGGRSRGRRKISRAKKRVIRCVCAADPKYRIAF